MSGPLTTRSTRTPTGGAARLGGRRLPWYVRRHPIMHMPVSVRREVRDLLQRTPYIAGFCFLLGALAFARDASAVALGAGGMLLAGVICAALLIYSWRQYRPFLSWLIWAGSGHVVDRDRIYLHACSSSVRGAHLRFEQHFRRAWLWWARFLWHRVFASFSHRALGDRIMPPNRAVNADAHRRRFAPWWSPVTLVR